MELKSLKNDATFNPTITTDNAKKPNNKSCVVCKRRYNVIGSYRQHLKNYHNNDGITQLGERKIISYYNNQPDPNDPNFFCRSCQIKHSTRDNFIWHIQQAHPNIKFEKIKLINPIMIEMDAGNPNNKWCTICEIEYASRLSYQNHVNRTHKVGKREPAARKGILKSRIDPTVTPIWDDSNNYCRSCMTTFARRANYRSHIKNFHGTVLQEAIQLSKSNPTQ